MLSGEVEGEWSACHHYQNGGFPEFGNFGEQFILHTGQVDVGATMCFAAQDGLFAHKQDYRFRFCGSFERFRKTFSVLAARGIQTACHVDVDVPGQRVADCLQRRLAPGFDPVKGPGAHLFVAVVGERTDDGHVVLMVCVERQNIVIVFQQDDAFECCKTRHSEMFVIALFGKLAFVGVRLLK